MPGKNMENLKFELGLRGYNNVQLNKSKNDIINKDKDVESIMSKIKNSN